MQVLQNSNSDTGTDSWYVQVNGQAYGPYTGGQMRDFVAEGRVNTQSMISQSAGQDYAFAGNFQSFTVWSGQQTQTAQQVQTQQSTQQSQVLRPVSASRGGVLARQIAPAGYSPQAVAPSPAPNPAPNLAPVSQPAQLTVFMVMAEIRSGNGMQFLQTLQTQGAAQRIGDAVWVLRSANSVEQLRNTLSQCLTRDDRLFLLDSFANKTAWFNIGADMDARIRELWDIER